MLNTATIPIGYMPMPFNFPFQETFLRGRPKHDKYDPFRIKHPVMPCSRRAKIFAPFDALKGFDEAIESKEVLYVGKRELSEFEKERLDATLRSFTSNTRASRHNPITVTVTCWQPCCDEHSFDYGSGGQYVDITGVVGRIDVVRRSIMIGDTVISFDDIVDIKDIQLPDGFSDSYTTD